MEEEADREWVDGAVVVGGKGALRYVAGDVEDEFCVVVSSMASGEALRGISSR